MNDTIQRITEEKSKWMRALKNGTITQERYDKIMDRLEEEERKASSRLSAICDRELRRVVLNASWRFTYLGDTIDINEEDDGSFSFDQDAGSPPPFETYKTKEDALTAAKKWVKKLHNSPRLSAICDRELRRMGLAHPGADVDDDELIAGIIRDGWDRGSASEVVKKWRDGKDVGREADEAIYRAAKRIAGK
jgi:hypothetical protein